MKTGENGCGALYLEKIVRGFEAWCLVAASRRLADSLYSRLYPEILQINFRLKYPSKKAIIEKKENLGASVRVDERVFGSTLSQQHLDGLNLSRNILCIF